MAFNTVLSYVIVLENIEYSYIIFQYEWDVTEAFICCDIWVLIYSAIIDWKVWKLCVIFKKKLAV